MKKIILFGVGDQAEMADYYFRSDSNHRVVAFTVDDDCFKQSAFAGKPVIPFSRLTRDFDPEHHGLHVAIGYSGMNRHRADKCAAVKALGYSLVSYISSRATLAETFRCGENCFILEGNNIQAFTTFGNNVVLWSGNHIGHHSRIEDNVFITSHVVVSGRVLVKRNAFIGVNTTLRNHITIGEYCVLGAASMVTKDTRDYGVYIGNPAKLIKPNSLDIQI